MSRFTYLNCSRHASKFPAACQFFPEFHNVVYCTAAPKCGIKRRHNKRKRK